jgi:hypothetical protein
MKRKNYSVEYLNTGMLGGSVLIHGRRWTAWPWTKWVKVWYYWDC